MIRIIHCLPGNMDMGGIEKFIMNIYHELDRSKYQFDFIVHKQSKNYFEDEIKNMGGKIYRLPNKRKHPIEYKKAFEKVICNYKIVHIHSVYAFTYYEAKWATKLGKQVIIHSHNSNAKFVRKVLHYFLRYKQEKYVRLKFAPSKLAAKWMFGKDTSDVVLINNAFQVRNFFFSRVNRNRYRRKLQINTGDYVLGCVGRLDWQKDPLFTLKVFKEVSQKSQNTKLIFIGEGALKNKLQLFIKKNSLQDKVIFTGNILNVNEYLNAFDAFLLPTRYEGLGISIVEAQINGLPVFTTDEVPDEAIISNKVNLFSKKDITIWVDGILRCERNRTNDRSINYNDFKDYDVAQVVKKLQSEYSLLDRA